MQGTWGKKAMYGHIPGSKAKALEKHLTVKICRELEEDRLNTGQECYLPQVMPIPPSTVSHLQFAFTWLAAWVCSHGCYVQVAVFDCLDIPWR